jgi:hypothetical protein
MDFKRLKSLKVSEAISKVCFAGENMGREKKPLFF